MPSNIGSASARNPRKRRKLSTDSKSSDQEEYTGDFSANSDGGDDSDRSVGDGVASASPPPRQRKAAGEPPKPRHRVHIVTKPVSRDDEFFSQAPPFSQGPHQPRGAFWQMPRPAPPSPGLPVVTPEQRTDKSGVSNQFCASARMPPPSLASSKKTIAAAPQRQGYAEGTRTDTERDGGMDREAALLDELADIPFDMLSSPAEEDPGPDLDSPEVVSQIESDRQYAERLSAPSRTTPTYTSFRQTTLLGTQAVGDGAAAQVGRSGRVHNWPVAGRDEAPTHHELNDEELQTWVYPTNLGSIRDYQFNIVSRGLFHNLLVALPTGLGKTFIAATIMLNWFRWTKSAQIVFVAPTRPLVAQQVRACFEIAGIPRSTTSLLTGNVAPGLRATEWAEKRVFFMTPQTIVNDLKTGICDPKRIVLVVVDEAHRATGNYAYVEVVKFLRRFNNSFRVLALTATPGSTTDAVQEVIDGLGIARTEIRTEESIDIRQYVHNRNIDTELFDYSEDTQFVMDLISAAIKPVLQKINSLNVYWSKDPMTLTAYGCMQARQKWMASPAGRNANFGLKAMVNAILTTLASLAHAIELLKFHGIVPFYNKVLEYQNGDGDGKNKGGKYKTMIVQHADFTTMMSTIRQWVRKEDFIGHPKLEYLSRVVLNHFIDAGEGRGVEPDVAPAATRIMIFAHFRDSAEEIVRVLKRHSPMVRPHVFVGQAASRGSEGMDQKKQQRIIDDFKKGVYNTLVATSIGEEGLDIGQVDLIVCYDASASPIRMLQRMGRTGRKRAGNIVVLLMKKKEQDNFEKAKDNYEKMQQMIADGSYFTYHDGLSPRILPKGINPEVDKRVVDIPLENSQADGELPEPKKKGRPPKRPPKKFHMPDGVMTGFLKASEIGQDGMTPKAGRQNKGRFVAVEPLPEVESVLLTPAENADLERRYLDVGGDEVQVVEYPRLDQFTELQRQERPCKLVGHGSATWRVIQLLNNMHEVDDTTIAGWRDGLRPKDKAAADAALRGDVMLTDTSATYSVVPIVSAKSPMVKSAAKRKAKQTPTKVLQPVAKRSKKRHGDLASNLVNHLASDHASDLISSMPGTEGEGIDLMSTDNEHDLDDDDEGSDLLDFIDDNTPVDDISSSSSPPDDSRMKHGRGKAGTAPTAPTATQEDTDNDPEGIDEMLNSAHKSKVGISTGITRRSRPGRAVVTDDSDDE